MRLRRSVSITWLGIAAALALATGAAAAALPVTIVSVTTPVARGGEGRMVVHTVPYARCHASVQAQNDPARTIASLPAQTADTAGVLTFSVHVPVIAKPGLYPVTVECQRGAKAAVTHLRVTVQ